MLKYFQKVYNPEFFHGVSRSCEADMFTFRKYTFSSIDLYVLLELSEPIKSENF